MKRNAIYKLLLNFFNLFVPLFINPYIVNLFSEETYGLYNRAYSEFQVAFVLGAFGIYNYGVRELSKIRQDRQATNRLFTSLFVIGVLANLVVSLGYFAYVFATQDTEVEVWVYALMTIQMVSNVFYVEFMNEVVENYRFITLKTIFVRMLYFIAIIVFVRKPTDVLIYTAVISLTVLLNNVISFMYVKRGIRFDFTKLSIVPHLLPLFITFLLTNAELLYSQLDKVLLGHIVNDIAVTEYAVPTMLVGMLNALPLALINVAIPRVSRLIGERKVADYRETLTRTMEVFFAICLPIFVGLAVVAPETLLLYGAKYAYAYPILIIAALGRMILAYQSVLMNLVMYVNRMERTLTYLLFKWGFINVFFKLILYWTGQFTVWATMTTTFLAILGFCLNAVWFIRDNLPFRIRFWTLRMTGYVVMTALFVPIRFVTYMLVPGQWLALGVTVLCCAVVYGGYLFATRDPFVNYILRRK